MSWNPQNAPPADYYTELYGEDSEAMLDVEVCYDELEDNSSDEEVLIIFIPKDLH